MHVNDVAGNIYQALPALPEVTSAAASLTQPLAA